MFKALSLIPVFLIATVVPVSAQWATQPPGETFSAKRVVSSFALRHPFAMVMGPDDSLWITERGGNVIRMNRTNGDTSRLLNLTAKVRFTTSGSGSSMGISQDGMFGLALHPQLNQGVGKDSVYLAYCYDSSGFRRVRISGFKYNRAVRSLTGEKVLLSGIWGSNDHNGGRLVIGNFGTVGVPNYKLVYTVGDKGANQFSNACDSIESQYIPTAAQLAAGDLHRYNGKILRLNLDGSIPADNPVINGVRSHIWTYGHRNPQGLSFQKKPDSLLAVQPQGKLYQSEQGPASNDEINMIDTTFNNYGWPRIAGKRDNNWYRYYQWSSDGSCSSYSSECSVKQSTSPLIETSFFNPKLQDPIFDLYPGTPSGGANCNWLSYPTIAPSSIIYYPFQSKIPGWKNCLLITTLKTSSVFKLKLNAAGTGPLSVADSVTQYFKDQSALNRYRDIAIGSDGISIYLLTDSVGTTSGPSAGSAGVTDRGRVLEYKYIGAVLAIGADPENPTSARLNFSIYPNPASNTLFIESKRNIAKPLQYKFYDASGRIMLTGSSTRDRFNITVSGLARGVYTVRIFNAHDIAVATEKIILK